MTTPYSFPVEHITDGSQWFEYDAKNRRVVFTGDTLEVRIPKRFEVHGMLNVTDITEALAIADLIIDSKYQASLLMLAKIRMDFQHYTQMVYDGVPYLVFHLITGDRFVINTEVVKDKSIIYALYVEFVTRGHAIYTISYDQFASMFDQAQRMCGSSLGVDHSVFEMITAHLARDPDNLTTFYRHTAMKKQPSFQPLRSVSLATDGTMTKLGGSYYVEGVDAALVTRNDHIRPLEQLQRGIPVQLLRPEPGKIPTVA